MIKVEAYQQVLKQCRNAGAVLVAVSKTKPVEDILALYGLGQKIFGENKVQEMLEKQPLLPKDIQWHLIGHLQTNKVKQVLPFVSLIHSVDSEKLLVEIENEAKKQDLQINILLQVKIAEEDTKFGLNANDISIILNKALSGHYPHVNMCGLMGMATLTDDESQVENEFNLLKSLYDNILEKYSMQFPSFKTLSMGMSGDYQLALSRGSNMVRVGSLIFGER
ncbi:MAG TPA: YggS family pyridoxal phosphate-dependent enzyme [Saprospiraceae bacterium]|nr:YggS family pyridoxal phosphate-dependent enzyme [Saprospiraceae bacterium]HRG19533.1 YggS family pyridoxal phosphate-dependent enzyme [Saprospiraceae bacterium]